MSDQFDSEQETLYLASLTERVHALFSSASSPEEVISMRDDLLQRIAEGASDARSRIAAEKLDGSSESLS